MTAQVFPFPANWRTPVSERLEWLTDVLEHRDASEQRVQLRQNCRQVIEYDFAAFTEHMPLLQSLLYGHQGQTWIVPLWFNQQALTEDITNGTQIPCVTEGYQFQAGAHVILYASATNFEYGTIHAVQENRVVLKNNLNSSWSAGTLIIPAYAGYSTDPITTTFANHNIATGVIRFYSESFIAPQVTLSLFDSYPVLDILPNRSQDMTEVWTRALEHLDNGVGQSYLFDLVSSTKSAMSYHFTLLDRLKINNYRNILYYLKGRLKPIWIPTGNQDMYLAEPIVTGLSTLTINYCAYTSQVFGKPTRQHLRIQTPERVFYRRIVAAVENVGTQRETLTLNEALDTTVGIEHVFISFLCLRRLDSDSVELSWVNPTLMETNVVFKEVAA